MPVFFYAIGSSQTDSGRLSLKSPVRYRSLLVCYAALLLHSRMNVEDVPIRITYVESAMAPRLGRQLLDPLDLEAFEPGVLPIHIRDFQLNQDAIIGGASHNTESVLCTLGLAPQGEG